MNGSRMARLSLRIDGVYCIVLGVAIAGSAFLVNGALAVPSALLVGVGVATAVWGAYVWRASSAVPLRSRTRFVMLANIAASVALAATGLVGGTAVLSLAAAVLAVDVAAFAVSQGIALRRMASPAA